MKKMAMALALLMVFGLLLSSCADSRNDSAAKETPVQPTAAVSVEPSVATPYPAEPSVAASADTSALSFRGIAFGSTWDEVTADKTLDVTKTYLNAMETEPVIVYTYRMQPTFWFNAAGEMFSGSYAMELDDYTAVAKKLQDRLTADYGEPEEVAYYDYNDQLVNLTTAAAAKAAIDDGSVFYCVTYDSPDGLTVELYVQSVESGKYEYYIYYTDPDYMD